MKAMDIAAAIAAMTAVLARRMVMMSFLQIGTPRG
jgi:hypothetical protein